MLEILKWVLWSFGVSVTVSTSVALLAILLFTAVG